MKPLRVLLVDDDEGVRDALSVVLNAQSGIEVVGEADNCSEALALVAACDPDVVLMDIRLPGDDGIEIAESISRVAPATRVIIHSAFDDRESEARSLGFEFLLKGCEMNRLLAVVRGERIVR